MKTGFTPIQLREYVELHLRANPEVARTELTQQLEFHSRHGRADVMQPPNSPPARSHQRVI